VVSAINRSPTLRYTVVRSLSAPTYVTALVDIDGASHVRPEQALLELRARGHELDQVVLSTPLVPLTAAFHRHEQHLELGAVGSFGVKNGNAGDAIEMLDEEAIALRDMGPICKRRFKRQGGQTPHKRSATQRS
jgi:hypothetical protein